MDFGYKTLTQDDAEAWRTLRIEGARDFPLGFLVTFEEAQAATVERCADILGFGALRGVFADDTLVGFCGYRPQQPMRTRHRAEIGPFFVTRAFQGTGAAQALMDGVVAEARASGLERLELYVDGENVRAEAFYARQGFERMATLYDTVRIDGVPRHDHFMTLV
ncbi:MAG: GNAT family N-acetyltransferase, partial [Pseudomonadota bacterium]